MILFIGYQRHLNFSLSFYVNFFITEIICEGLIHDINNIARSDRYVVSKARFAYIIELFLKILSFKNGMDPEKLLLDLIIGKYTLINIIRILPLSVRALA